MKKYQLPILLLPLIIILPGCASLNLQRKKIEFTDPVNILQYKSVKPNADESKGILLRLSKTDRPAIYKDYYQIYTQISDGNAIPIYINKKRKVTFSKGKENNSFYTLTETSTDNKSESGLEKILVDDRGEIIEFIKGEFKTSKGSINFISHTRTPVFPENRVRTGDKWSYEETLEMELDSLLISRKSEKPDNIKVSCKLEGFAIVSGKRCAVISASTVAKRKEHYTTLFKEMKVNVNIFVNEKIFFDYINGINLGVITKTESFSVSENLDFSDHSRSQSVSVLTQNKK